MGFSSAWGYWISAWLGNVGYFVLLFSTLGYFFPIFGEGNTPAAIIGASILLWAVHFLVLRGIKTLAVRMDRHNENAMKVANWLRTQPKVKKVYYVGFEDHKDYAVTKKQTTGFGGMISFTVDSFETVKKILKGVDMIMFAESLGGTETLITYPTTQTHEDTPLDIKEKLGITDSFLRMSVGIENADDIIADLDRAMNS